MKVPFQYFDELLLLTFHKRRLSPTRKSHHVLIMMAKTARMAWGGEVEEWQRGVGAWWPGGGRQQQVGRGGKRWSGAGEEKINPEKSRIM